MMSGNMENHGFRFPGELTEVPMTLRQLVEWNRSLDIIFVCARRIPDSRLHEHLTTVLSMACDFLCSICEEYGIDPLSLDYLNGEDDMDAPLKPKEGRQEKHETT